MGMRKLALSLVAMLTIASPASASGGPPIPAPAPNAGEDPAPDAEPTSDRQEQRHASARRFERAEIRKADREEAPAPVAVSPALQAIAQCESGGDPSAVGGGGQFRGKYQFTFDTWSAVGGEGDPANAPEAEQDRRAATLYAQSGPGQWPVCGG